MLNVLFGLGIVAYSFGLAVLALIGIMFVWSGWRK